MKKNYLLSALLLSGLFSAQYEPFDYSTAINQNGWTTHNGTSGEIVPVTTASDLGNSLNYNGIVTPQGNRISISPTLSEDANKVFTAPITTTAYVSFLMKVTDVSALQPNTFAFAPPYFVHFAAGSGSSLGSTGLVSRLGMRQGSAANTFNIAVLNTTGGTASVTDLYGTSPADYQVGTTYFVVLKYDMTGTTGTTSFWVNPTTSSESTPTHTTAFGTSAKASQISSFAIRQLPRIPTVELDEIRMGNSWADVVNSALSVLDVKTNKKLISNTLVKDNFRVLLDSKANVEIYSTTGILVKKINVNPNDLVDVSALAKGVYFIKINDNETVYNVKIIKQ